ARAVSTTVPDWAWVTARLDVLRDRAAPAADRRGVYLRLRQPRGGRLAWRAVPRRAAHSRHPGRRHGRGRLGRDAPRQPRQVHRGRRRAGRRGGRPAPGPVVLTARAGGRPGPAVDFATQSQLL